MIPTLFDRIGGASAVGAIVNKLYDRLLSDPLTKPYFDGHDMRELKKHQRAFLTVALGGPEAYYGQDIKSAHRHLRITNAEFDAVATHLSCSMAELNLPATIVTEAMGVVGTTRADIVDNGLQRI